MKKRLISLLLCLCMMFPMQMMPVWAAEESTATTTTEEQAEQTEQKEESPCTEEEEASPIPAEEALPVEEEEVAPVPAESEVSPAEEVCNEESDLTLLEETDTRYLSDLTPTSATVGWGNFQRDKNVDGGDIYIFVGGVKTKFTKGIAAHAQATIIYDLGESHNYNYLSGYFSVDASKAGNANAKIQVYTTNNTNSWGYPVFTSDTLTGANSVPLSQIDITGYRYLKIYCDPNGHNGYDHTVVADAKVYKDTSYVAPTYDVVFTKYNETADKETIAAALNKEGATYASLLGSNDTKKALMTRMFMMKLGSGSDDYIKNQQAFLTGTDDEITQRKALLQWLKDNPDYMAELLAGGDPEGCTFLESMNILSKLYAAHGEDIACTDALITTVRDDESRKKGDVYRTMMFAIALSGNVYAWLDTGSLQDPVVRYEKFKVLYNHQTYQLRNEIFENLCVEEMRYVMNIRIWNDEITWLNAYVRNNNKGVSSFPSLYSPHRYLRYGKDWDNAAKGYLNEANYPTHAATYSLNTYGDDFVVPFSTKSKLWMVFAGSHICWGISYTGTSFAAAFGVPSKYVTQPGHGAWLIMNRGTDANSSTWGIDNNIYGWTSTSLVGWNLGNEHVRTMCGWGIPKNGWVSNNESSYILLSQYALNHETEYAKAELLMSMDSYTGADKEAVYEQVLDIMPYHLDAWYNLVKYYTANKSAQDMAALAVRIGANMKSFPLPMHDLIALLRTAVQNGNDADKALYLAQINTIEDNALITASDSSNVLPNQMQGDVMATMAKYLRGKNTNATLAAFSFDGTAENSIIIGDTYAGVTYQYSLDGGATWSETSVVTGTEGLVHKLTAAEVSQISADKDILIWLLGWPMVDNKPVVANAYRIDILAGSAVSGLEQNDKENRFFGNVSNIEYSIDNQATWQDLTDETRFVGEQTVYLQKKATGCTMQGTVSSPYTFTENSTEKRSYIPISRLTLEGCSSEEVSRQNNAAKLAIDGLRSTLWHTLWDGSDKERYIILKADEPTFFSGLDYTPRQDGGTNGNITACSIYASMDGTDWYLVDSVSSWSSDKTVKHMTFTSPTYGQYIKVVVTGGVGNFASASAIELFENTTYKDKAVAGVRLDTKPTKTNYVVGEVPSIAGATVTCVYTDGETSSVPLSMLRVSPSVLNAEGKQTIELTYMNYPAMTYEVTVGENTRTPNGITVEKQPNKTQYYAGQTLDLTGMVIKATDGSGNEWYPEDYTVSVGENGEDTLTAGTQTVTVTYRKITTTFTVTVQEVPEAISITTPPTKNEYNIGEALDTTDMVVTLTYQDKTTKELKDGYTVAVDDMALPGEKTMTVTLTDYPSLSASTTITIRTNLRDGDYEFEVLMAEEIEALKEAGKVSNEDGKYPCYLSAYTNTQETAVTVPAEVTVNGVTYQVIGVRDNAFASATQVTSLALPGTVQILESGSLTDLENLENLYLSGVKKISDLSIADGSLPENESGKIYMASSTLSNALGKELEDYQGLSEGSPVMQTGNLLSSDQLSKLVVTPPEQKTFELNEDFTFSVNVLLKNGLSIPLNASQYTVTGDTSSYGTQTITVKMTGTSLTDTFTVDVAKTAPVIRVNPKDTMYLDESTEIAPITTAVMGNDGDKFVCQWYCSEDSQFDTAKDVACGASITQKCNGSDLVTFTYTPTETGYYYAVVWKLDKKDAQSKPAQSMAAHIQIVDGNDYPILVEGKSEVYETLAEAFTHAASGSTIIVRGNEITLNSSVSFSQKSFTLKGENGAETIVKRGEGVTGAMFQLSGTASLTVENLTIDSGAVWSGTTDATLGRGTTNTGITANNGVFQLSGTSALKLNNGAVLQNAATSASGAVAYMIDTATLTVDGATIQNCAASSEKKFGGAFWLERGGKIVVESGNFKGNYAAGYGGVIATNSGSAQETEILGGTFENNKSPNGGVIFIGGASALTISGGTFQNNTATNGGVIHNYNGGTITVNGGTMLSCKAEKDSTKKDNWENGNGGAIYSAKEKGGKIILNGGKITSCTANGNGGAIYTGNATVTINSGTIESCSAGWGGGVYAETGKVTMTGGTIQSCSATCGGGIDANSAPIEISGGQILSCTSNEKDKGAAIHTDAGEVTISGGTFYGNLGMINSETADVSIGMKKGTISGGYYDINPKTTECLTKYVADNYTSKEENIEGRNLYHVTVDIETSFSLSLKENFAINFYLTPMSGTEAKDYTVTATFAGETTVKSSLSDMTPMENGRYSFVVANAYSYQMTEPVTVQVSYNGQLVEECTYSVQDYCTDIIKANDDAELVNLCKAVLQYGGDAQRYFKDKTYENGTAYQVFPSGETVYADKDITRSNPKMPNNTASIKDSLTGFDDFTASLILGNEVSMKVYFDYTGEDAITGYTFSCDNVKTVTEPQLVSGNTYFVKITGITPCDLSKDFTLSITKDEETSMSITYSVFAFAASKWTEEQCADELLRNLCQSLVQYGLMADAYFDSHQ